MPTMEKHLRLVLRLDPALVAEYAYTPDYGLTIAPMSDRRKAVSVQGLENKFQNDIKPNIKAYLKKYHVTYILKDKVLDPSYHPEALGAALVYADDRYEIYHLTSL